MPDDDGMRSFAQALEDGTPTQAEIASYRKDGSTYWNQVSLHPVRNADGARDALDFDGTRHHG